MPIHISLNWTTNSSCEKLISATNTPPAHLPKTEGGETLIGITCVNKNFDPPVFNLQRFNFELQVKNSIPGLRNCENKFKVD